MDEKLTWEQAANPNRVEQATSNLKAALSRAQKANAYASTIVKNADTEKVTTLAHLVIEELTKQQDALDEDKRYNQAEVTLALIGTLNYITTTAIANLNAPTELIADLNRTYFDACSVLVQRAGSKSLEVLDEMRKASAESDESVN